MPTYNSRCVNPSVLFTWMIKKPGVRPKKLAPGGRERSRSRRRNDWGDKGGEDPQTVVVDKVELKNWSRNAGMLLFQALIVLIYLEI